MLEPRRYLAIALVAALLLVACGGGEPTEPEAAQPDSPAGDIQAEAPKADIVVVGTASLEFQPSEVEAEAGTVSVALTSEGGPHTFTIELEEGDETVAQVFGPGETDVGETEVEAGTYTFFCAIPGHREDGMEGTLTVS
ncbi:MAG TPA: plastocyanin/azurin family copper-binding protein [Actinomycetota bacterium]|nr:plastocyanin/azurin family copper-binding protein [Actinomycetota bacterium]